MIVRKSCMVDFLSTHINVVKGQVTPFFDFEFHIIRPNFQQNFYYVKVDPIYDPEIMTKSEEMDLFTHIKL